MGYWRVKDGPQGFMLQGGRMQGSSGSAGISFQMFVCFRLSSSSSSVGVMQVEDSRRVTQEALVIVDDSWMNIRDDLFIHLSNRK
jgi:hypothetical protein